MKAHRLHYNFSSDLFNLLQSSKIINQRKFMHFKFLLSLIVNLLSTVIYSQNYDTIVFSGPFQPKLSILIEQDNYREYNIFDEKPLNAVVLNNFLEIKKVKEVYKNGWKVKNDTIITNQENELFKKAKRLCR